MIFNEEKWLHVFVWYQFDTDVRAASWNTHDPVIISCLCHLVSSAEGGVWPDWARNTTWSWQAACGSSAGAFESKTSCHNEACQPSLKTKQDVVPLPACCGALVTSWKWFYSNIEEKQVEEQRKKVKRDKRWSHFRSFGRFMFRLTIDWVADQLTDWSAGSCAKKSSLTFVFSVSWFADSKINFPRCVYLHFAVRSSPSIH